MERCDDESAISTITTYSDLARELAKMISLARRDIYVASRYYEPAIGSKIVSKFAEGLSVHLIDANGSGVTFEERLKAASAPDTKNRELILRLLGTPNAVIRVDRLDYSFVVVDSRSCGIELVNPSSPDNFYCALRFENPIVARKLKEIFDALASAPRRVITETPQLEVNPIRQ